MLEQEGFVLYLNQPFLVTNGIGPGIESEVIAQNPLTHEEFTFYNS